MKNAIKALKQKAHAQRTGADRLPPAPTGPHRALLAVVAVFTALATIGLFEYVILCKLPVELLGPWVIMAHDTDPEKVGLTMEFHRDGSMGIFSGGKLRDDGLARVEDDRLSIAIFDHTGGLRATSYLLIDLTATHLVLEMEPAPDGSHTGGMIALERPVGNK